MKLATNEPKVTAFKTVAEFRQHLAEKGFNIGLADEVKGDGTSAMAQKLDMGDGCVLGNRWAILPMEGWDCGKDGAPSDLTRRRWLRFAESGAKMLFGTEAAAVMHTGRSNPNQLLCNENTLEPLKNILADMRRTHKEKFGRIDDMQIGLQLTHSGRFSHPNEAAKLESVTAYAHPLLDQKFHSSPANVVSDEEVKNIIRHFIKAAEVAQKAGFDFVDVKHAHGYLAHEFLTAVDRPGPYGGSFENRTRFFREVAEGIHKHCPGLKIAVRLSIFDIKPFLKGEDGIGHAMAWPEGKFYPYAFGGCGDGMHMDSELTEPVKFVNMLKEYGVKLICASIGSPYYNVHMQRPAYYAVSDGYGMPEPPLYNVARHLEAVRVLKEKCPGIITVGSGYTCLQDYLPNAAEYAVANGWTDLVGIGRMVLSYPEMCADSLAGRPLKKPLICRTFGECTNAPRNGMVSGCYPLDCFYKARPEAEILKKM